MQIFHQFQKEVPAGKKAISTESADQTRMRLV